MRIGIVADVHEDVEGLAVALALLKRETADLLVVLGDVFDSGKRIGETVALLAGAGAVGVWGNHELGLCHRPSERTRARYAGPVLDFMQTLRPRLEAGSCLFSHGLPCWDAADPAEYYLGDRPETEAGRAAAFASSPCRVSFVGHFHRWLLTTPQGPLAWDGKEAVVLAPPRRSLVVVAAVRDGRCALFDTDTSALAPLRCRAGATA
jgi:hypothetical protein